MNNLFNCTSWKLAAGEGKKIIVFLLLYFLLFSCLNKSSQRIVEKIDIDEWNKSTIEILQNKLQINEYDYSKNANSPSPFIVVNGIKIYTIQDHINYWLSARKNFIKEINAFGFICNNLEMVESYTQNKATYIFKECSNENYYLLVIERNQKNKAIRKITTGEYESLVDIINNNVNNFINDMNFSPTYLRIKTEVSFNKKGQIIYKCQDIFLL